MLTGWRLCRREHARLDGEGARLYGGRWNRRGTPVVYLGSTLSLACLEYLVHLESGLEPADLVSVRVSIPSDAPSEAASLDDLPRNWRLYPAPETLQDIGDEWARRGDSLVLTVPSVVVPEERNILVNPRHPRMRDVSAERPLPFPLDPRMRK